MAQRSPKQGATKPLDMTNKMCYNGYSEREVRQMKSIAIEMYADSYDMFGTKRVVYVTTVWGTAIRMSGTRWSLRDSSGHVIAVGNISELHGQGQDMNDIKFKCVISY